MQGGGQILEQSNITLADWLDTPLGQYVHGFCLQQVDAAVEDAFGFHALQLGLPHWPSLASNRMPHRWVAHPAWLGAHAGSAQVSLFCEFDALPLPDASVDLVVMPHTLELARDAHLTLREVERVLRPEGRVVIVAFNPASSWGLRQKWGQFAERLRQLLRRQRGPTVHDGGLEAAAFREGQFLPQVGEWIGYRRLRDWLRLLGFEVETTRFGCWRLPIGNPVWLNRLGWMDALGDRWAPALGAVVVLSAVKRVQGLRLIGLVRDQRRVPRRVPVSLAGAGARGAQHSALQRSPKHEANDG